MAVYRNIPLCNICGEPIAKPIYDEESKIIGDNFLRWETIPHLNCNQLNINGNT